MKQILLIIYCMVFLALASFAQKENLSISNGNNLYKQNNFEKSAAEYKKALALAPANPVANYNLGNAAFKSKDYETAVNSYDAAIKNGKDKATKEKAHYNQGVSYSQQQKLAESIQAWKNALKLDPDDTEARENLQKALLEKRKQDEEDKKKEEEKKKDEKDKKKDKDKEEKDKPQPQKPQQQPSKLNQKQVEQLLKALAQKEKELQDRMQSRNASPVKQEKDW